MARERYLHNAGEDTIHDNEIKLVTGKDKRANWWFYHKRQIIPVTLVVLLVVVFIHSMVTKVEPDYTIGLLTSYTMPENGLKQLEECITPYADDRNGDGQVVVNVTNYPISNSASADPTSQQAAWARFAGDASMNQVIIYLHDEGSFAALKGEFAGFLQYNDGTPMPTDATDYENAMVAFEDVAAFADFHPRAEVGDLYTSDILEELFSRLRVSLRAAEGSSIEKKEKDVQYYNDCVALFDRLQSGQELPAETGTEEG